MSLFTQHTDTSAPAGAAEVLAQVRERYGFIPNLAAYVAESPVVLDAILGLSGGFDRVTLTAPERQVVQLVVSVMNGCGYCRTVHTALGRMAGLEGPVAEAVIAGEPLADARLEALRMFTLRLVEQRGWVSEDIVRDFLAAGFSRAQVFEVVLGVALKTLTNYCNHLAGAEPNPEFEAMARGPAAA